MKTAVIIPARLGSTRLARKPLHQIAGMSLIERVWRRCAESQDADMLAVATDSDEIAKHVESFGGKAIMTPPECTSGTERVAVAAHELPAEFDIIINVQGDEPLVEPKIIGEIVSFFKHNLSAKIVTPVSPLLSREDLNDPNVVKAALCSDGRALYFSRAPIPFEREPKEKLPDGAHWKHIGIYGFRRKILGQVIELLPSKLEDAEKLEQLRWLDGGYVINTIVTDYDAIAVDTIEDLRKVEAILQSRK
jgi:3-deoxy-manno-octulosonate cytidylyltransferase (CMP-KDO synthetase)